METFLLQPFSFIRGIKRENRPQVGQGEERLQKGGEFTLVLCIGVHGQTFDRWAREWGQRCCGWAYRIHSSGGTGRDSDFTLRAL